MPKTIVIISWGNSFDTYEEYLKELDSWSVRFYEEKTGWKTTFFRELSALEHTVLMPTMPNKNNARYAEWKLIFEKFALELPPDTVYIGHSLGGIFLAKYFSENNTLSAGQIHLIAAPFSPRGDMRLGEDLSKLATRENITLWHSKDDPVVDYSELAFYEKVLPLAKTRVFDDRAHFNGERFDELMEAIMIHISR